MLKFTPSLGRGRSAAAHRTILLITGIYLTFWHLAGVEDFELVKNKNMFAFMITTRAIVEKSA